MFSIENLLKPSVQKDQESLVQKPIPIRPDVFTCLSNRLCSVPIEQSSPLNLMKSKVEVKIEPNSIGDNVSESIGVESLNFHPEINRSGVYNPLFPQRTLPIADKFPPSLVSRNFESHYNPTDRVTRNLAEEGEYSGYISPIQLPQSESFYRTILPSTSLPSDASSSPENGANPPFHFGHFRYLPRIYQNTGDAVSQMLLNQLIEHHKSSIVPLYNVYQAGSRASRRGGQVRFTGEQTRQLEVVFSENKYITPPHRRQLAERLDLHERQVKTWFQNRRAKWRKVTNQEGTGQTTQAGNVSPSQDKELSSYHSGEEDTTADVH